MMIHTNLIIYNALLYDPIDGFLNASAIGIDGNKIVLLGSDKEILGYRRSETQVINARGKILLPCFTDGHIHFIGYVRRKEEVRLEHCTSLDETLSHIKKKVERSVEGEWITGGGWNRNLWPSNQYPHFRLLDQISARHFIALDSKDWHTTWVNSPVLHLAGISAEVPYKKAKHLAVHPVTGEFTGVLEEEARLKVYQLLPKLNYAKLRKSYLSSLLDFYRLGFSGIHIVETPDEFEVFREAKLAGEIGLRTNWYVPIQMISKVTEFSQRETVGDDFLRISGTKVFVDGTFGSQTAELTENYRHLHHAGIGVLDQQQLKDFVNQSVKNKLSCAIHAIGDRAVRRTLHAIGEKAKQSRSLDLRHRIEHAQMVHPNDIHLFKKYNVIASVQPLHIAYDISLIEKYLGERGKFTYPLASLHQNEVNLIFGSDAPVEDFHPWKAIYSAMERRLNLNPTEPSFYPEEKLNLPTCIKAYTYNAAKAVGVENRLARLQLNMLADFFLVDRDVFNIELPALKDAESVLTVIDGEIVYRNLE
jgi:predicted amidohydrolase YtcJ